MDPKEAAKRLLRGTKPFGEGVSGYWNNLTARGIDGGVAKTKLSTLCFWDIFRPLKPKVKLPGGLNHKEIIPESLTLLCLGSNAR